MMPVKSSHFYKLKSKIEETQRTATWLATLNYRCAQKDVILRTILPSDDDTTDFARCKEDPDLFVCAVFADNPNIPVSIRNHLMEREQIVSRLSTRGKKRWEWLDYIKAPAAHMLEAEHKNAGSPTKEDNRQERPYIADSTDGAVKPEDYADDIIDDDTREIDIKDIKAKIDSEDSAQEDASDIASKDTKQITITPSLSKIIKSGAKPKKSTPPAPVIKAAPAKSEEPAHEPELMAIAPEEPVEEVQERQRTFHWPTPPIAKKGNGQQTTPMGELWNTIVNKRDSWIETASLRNIAAYFNTANTGTFKYQSGKTMAIPSLKSIREGKSIPFGDSAAVPKETRRDIHPPAASSENPEASAHFDRGLESLRRKKYAEALKHFEDACKAAPENSLYRINFKRLKILVTGKTSE